MRQSEIEEILSRKRGKLKVKDLIDIEGKKSLLEHLKTEAKEIKAYLGELERHQAEAKESADKFDDPDRRKTIVETYGERFEVNAKKLQVTALSEHVFKNVNASIDESGSDLPRAVLAYYFAVVSLIVEGKDGVNFPLVIDAPNQQEQDKGNLYNILDFIVKNRPKNSQLVVGLVDDANVYFPGKRILLNKKYAALESGEYLELSKKIRHFEVAHMSGASE